MSRAYTLLASTFSPESARIVRLGLRRRGANTPEELRAWASEYHAEASRMTGPAWDCEEMESGLAANEKRLVGAAAAAALNVGRHQASSEVPELNEQALSRFVRERMGLVKACYENALKRDQTLRGRIAIRFAIVEDGSIADVVSSSETLGKTEIPECLARAFRSWHTPFRPARTVTIEYPFFFTPAK